MSGTPRNLTGFASAMPRDLERAAEPLVGLLISVILSLAAITIISAFLTRKLFNGRPWRSYQPVQWIVVALYGDSWMFVFATAIVQYGLGVDFSFHVCESAILLCLVCYVSSKLVYLFLAERAYIIRGSHKPRMRSPIYIFNCFGMLSMYSGIAVINFVHRIARMENGQCVIGMEKGAIIPLIAFDVVANAYLTLLFLLPLYRTVTFKDAHCAQSSAQLRRVAKRTVVGAVCTLMSSFINLLVLLVLDGEPGWVCLMCCNSDILFSVVVIQWVTSPDKSSAADKSSKNDSHELESQIGEPDAIVPVRRTGRVRRNNLSDLEDLDVPDEPDRSQSQASSRRELSTEAMIDGREAISSSPDRTQSGSTDTLPNPRPFELHVTVKPTTAEDKLINSHGKTNLDLPPEAHMLDKPRWVSGFWRSNV